jgi:hypothetical protein
LEGKSVHVFGVHVDVGGAGTHDARSQIMYSRIFSCEVIGTWLQYVVRFAWEGKDAAAQRPLHVPLLRQLLLGQSLFRVQAPPAPTQLLLEQPEFCVHVPAPVAELDTWKSLKMECPHCAVTPTGVLNV